MKNIKHRQSRKAQKIEYTLTNVETCYDKVFNGANSNMNHGFNNNHNAE